jgi:hypothetical protein
MQLRIAILLFAFLASVISISASEEVEPTVSFFIMVFDSSQHKFIHSHNTIINAINIHVVASPNCPCPGNSGSKQSSFAEAAK